MWHKQTLVACVQHMQCKFSKHIFGHRHLPTAVQHVLFPVGFNKANACKKISLRLHTCSNVISSKLLNTTDLCLHSFLRLYAEGMHMCSHICAYTLSVLPQSPMLGHQGLKPDNSVKALPGLPSSGRRVNILAPLVAYDVVF